MIRHDSGKDDPRGWVHIGHDDVYLAVYRASDTTVSGKVPYDGKAGINHLGFVVDDVEQLRKRLLGKGFTETTVPNHHPARRRVYFNDAEGNDWEFVQYFSDDPNERNDYTLE